MTRNPSADRLLEQLARTSELVEPRPVERIARVLAVVPSLRPATRAWRRLGFSLTRPFELHGCRAIDLVLRDGGIRFLAPDPDSEPTPLSRLVDERLIMGAGILGWSWACESIFESRKRISERADTEIPLDQGGGGILAVPTELTPGAATLLEPIVNDTAPAHSNRVAELHHVVLAVTDVESAAKVYENTFALGATRRKIGDRRYAFLKAGDAMIEIVGPRKRQAGPLGGHAWGLGFRSADLDDTIATLKREGIELPEIRSAAQGKGRMTGLPISLGGINIAFIGD